MALDYQLRQSGNMLLEVRFYESKDLCFIIFSVISYFQKQHKFTNLFFLLLTMTYSILGGIGLYPWGDGTKPFVNGKWMMNVYNGTNFPYDDTGMDGYFNVCPANAFEPNNYEIYNMLGNIWEWTQSMFVTENPKNSQFVLKGGSFIDSVDGNVNHKVTATTRMGNTADAGSNNIGFRCVSGLGGGRKAPPDQKKMQEIMAESGVEGVQEYLASQGSNAQVMSAKDLAEKYAKT
jgi:hypothetical protein